MREVAANAPRGQRAGSGRVADTPLCCGDKISFYRYFINNPVTLSPNSRVSPRTEPLYRAAVVAHWCDVSCTCSMLQTFCLMNHFTSVVPHVRTCFLNVHTLQIERYIGCVLLSATLLGTDLVIFPHGAPMTNAPTTSAPARQATSIRRSTFSCSARR